MGWMWKSQKDSEASTNDDNNTNSNAVNDNYNQESIGTRSIQAKTTSLSFPENEIIEHEFKAFLAEAAEGSVGEVMRLSKSNSLHTQPNPSAPNQKVDTTYRERESSISEHLLPTTMSCREAFDSAFYCNSLGGAFNHLYRYGTARSCSDHWDKFWFCMRTRTYDETAKKKIIKDYYRDIERKKYGKRGTSSEDVWKSRDHLLDPGTAFQARDEEYERSDDEWRNAILEMRQKILKTEGK